MSTLVQVTGTWLNPDDTPASGVVVLELLHPHPNTTPPRVVATGPVRVELDDMGGVTADVVASDDPGWPGGAIYPYAVTVALDGHRVARYQVSILAPGPVDLTQLTPVCVGESVTVVPVPGAPGHLSIGQVTTGEPGDPAGATITGTPPTKC
jgi:hypothetical protein